MPEFNWRQMRAILAARRIAHQDFARACGLSAPFVSRLLTGYSRPGRLSQILIAQGCEKLGLPLDRELPNDAA